MCIIYVICVGVVSIHFAMFSVTVSWCRKMFLDKDDPTLRITGNEILSQLSINVNQKQEMNFHWFMPLKRGDNLYHCKAKPDPDHPTPLVSFSDLAMVS